MRAVARTRSASRSRGSSTDRPTRPIGRPDDSTLQLREVPFDLERAAEALGLSVEELRALLSQGITVLRLADERGIPIEKIVARVTAAMAEKIGDLVDSGLIDAGRAGRCWRTSEKAYETL